jgi:hypothetical protein
MEDLKWAEIMANCLPLMLGLGTEMGMSVPPISTINRANTSSSRRGRKKLPWVAAAAAESKRDVIHEWG